MLGQKNVYTYIFIYVYIYIHLYIINPLFEPKIASLLNRQIRVRFDYA
jgi:hypothetical protein